MFIKLFLSPILVLISAIFVGCLEEDSPSGPNDVITEGAAGAYTGSGDFTNHFTGYHAESVTVGCNVNVQSEDEYRVELRFVLSSGTHYAYPRSDRDGDVNYRAGNMRYVGNIDYWSDGMDGSITAYEVQTSGTEVAKYDYVFSLERVN